MSKVAVVVISHDGNQDLWLPFFDFFKKFWPNCEYPVYLTTNFLNPNIEGVHTVRAEKKTTWSDEMITILHELPYDHLIVILDDYFIYKPVNLTELHWYISRVQDRKIDYLRLAAFPSKYNKLWPSTDLVGNDGKILQIDLNAQYLVDLQVAIWNRQSLLDLLDPSESPWEFEPNATFRGKAKQILACRIRETPGVKYVHGPITYYCTAVSRGAWMRGALKLCKKNNITVDTSKRRIESRLQFVFRSVYIALPISLRRYVDFVGSKLKFLKLNT